MPAFIGIGAMRSGTTWLAAHLARHPDIWMGRKEIHFFDRRLPTHALRSGPRRHAARLLYGLRFLPGVLRGKVTGEITPAYAILDPAVIALVRSWVPDARLIFLLRDPAERAWSQVRNDFPLHLGRPLAEASRDDVTSYLDSTVVRRKGDYAASLRNWLAEFPREQLFVGFLDEIRTDPADLLRRVQAFVGVEPSVGREPGLDTGPIGASLPRPMPDWVREHLAARLPPDREEIERLIGRPVPWGRDGRATP